jgi:hypothetical protein
MSTGSTGSKASVLTTSTIPGFHQAMDDELVELPRPSDLPEEWSQMVTKRGRIFYLKFDFVSQLGVK